uniref:Uncharacterized protein n=1 Tax=Chenopodium quinoa TaxID=63459 RepID=A0A803N7B1_CHEQI
MDWKHTYQNWFVEVSDQGKALVEVNRCMGKMGKAVIEEAANAGLHIVHGPSKREDILASVYDEYPELIVVYYTVPTAVNVRRDIDDTHLKTGAAGAFAVVKGLATLYGGSPLEFNSTSFLSHVVDGAFFVFQDLFIFTCVEDPL